MISEYVANKVSGLASAACAFAGGYGVGNFPQYLAQYTQRLGGHIDEARINGVNYNIQELSEIIQDLRNLNETLKEKGKGISAVERNADRIMANIKMLELNVSDLVDVI